MNLVKFPVKRTEISVIQWLQNKLTLAKSHPPANLLLISGNFSSSLGSRAGVYYKSRLCSAFSTKKMTQTMVPKCSTCTILADRHMALVEGVRDLLETAFQTVYLVADTSTLRDGALRLLPALIVLDLSLAGHDSAAMLQEIRDLSPATRILVLTVYDESSVARMALTAGAHGVVLKRCIGSDFLKAVDAVLSGQEFVSPDIGAAGPVH